MKNILLAIGCIILFSTLANAQQRVTLDKFSLTIPSNAKKMATESYKSKPASFSVQMNWEGIANNCYMIGNMLLAYRLVKDQDLQKMTLEDRKKMDAYLYSQHSKISEINPKIITLNHGKFLVVEYKQGDDYFITFTSEYDAKNQFLNGFFQYKLADKSNAEKQAISLLESVRLN